VGLAMLRHLQKEFAGRASTLHATIHPKNIASLGLFRAAGAELGERVLAYVPVEEPAGRSTCATPRRCSGPGRRV
jgi:hypothetical protein